MRPAPRALAIAAALAAACWGERAYILEGTVLEHTPDGRVVIDHEAVPGLMGPMVMPFAFEDPAIREAARPGSRIVARLMREERGLVLDKVRVTGFQPLAVRDDGGPVRPGATLPAVTVDVGDGAWTVGDGQGAPTLLTFLYTTCPDPAFCPMVTSRLQGVQAALTDADTVRLLAVTLDPQGDTRDVLDAYASTVGADPAVWRFGRLDAEGLQALALRAGLSVIDDRDNGGKIVHALRWLVLDAQGRLAERYDDNGWPLDRVLEQLRTGGPPAPPGSDGTVSRPPEGAGPG